MPYVVWTVIYTGLQTVSLHRRGADVHAARPRAALRNLALNLATGTAWYHLYFLLVSMQFYLLFPLFQRLLVATRGRHRWVLAAAAVLQVLVDLWVHDPAPTGVKADLLPYAGSFVGSYVFFLVLGGVVALHRERVLERAPPPPGARRRRGRRDRRGGRRLVPVGGRDRDQRAVRQRRVPARDAAVGGRGGGRVRVARDGVGEHSGRSVPAVGDLGVRALLRRVPGAPGDPLRADGRRSVRALADLPPPLPTVAVYLAAVIGSLALVALFRRTPLRMPLTGKPSDRRQR